MCWGPPPTDCCRLQIEITIYAHNTGSTSYSNNNSASLKRKPEADTHIHFECLHYQAVESEQLMRISRQTQNIFYKPPEQGIAAFNCHFKLKFASIFSSQFSHSSTKETTFYISLSLYASQTLLGLLDRSRGGNLTNHAWLTLLQNDQLTVSLHKRLHGETHSPKHIRKSQPVGCMASRLLIFTSAHFDIIYYSLSKAQNSPDMAENCSVVGQCLALNVDIKQVLYTINPLQFNGVVLP